MSKSKGNVIPALETLKKYDNENAVRFYFLKDGPVDRDECFNSLQLVDSYNAHVVNEFANSIRRVTSEKFLPASFSFKINKPTNQRELQFINSFNEKSCIFFNEIILK